MQSAWSADLPRDQWSGWPGLCLSLPNFESRATAASAAGK